MSDTTMSDTTHIDDASAAPMTLYVCTTCRDPLEPLGAARPGERLYAALAALPGDALVEIVPVECLSVCRRPCTVAFASTRKWTYVFGDLSADTAADTVLSGARLYAGTKDGIIPWKLRPDAFKKGVVSRVPPLPGPSA